MRYVMESISKRAPRCNSNLPPGEATGKNMIAEMADYTLWREEAAILTRAKL